MGMTSLRLILQITRLRRDDCGATAVEYGLLLGLISVSVIGAFQIIGTGLDDVLRIVASAISKDP